jgi:hypothetical protein
MGVLRMTIGIKNVGDVAVTDSTIIVFTSTYGIALANGNNPPSALPMSLRLEEKEILPVSQMKSDYEIPLQVTFAGKVPHRFDMGIRVTGSNIETHEVSDGVPLVVGG